MTIFTVGFTVLAALLHVYIWVLESFRWTHPATRRTFGVSEADAGSPMGYPAQVPSFDASLTFQWTVRDTTPTQSFN